MMMIPGVCRKWFWSVLSSNHYSLWIFLWTYASFV